MSANKPAPIRTITVILHTRDRRYWGFRHIRCRDRRTVEAQVSGDDSNIRSGLFRDPKSPSGWRDDYFYTYSQVTEKDLFAMPFAGSQPGDIATYVKKGLRKEPEPPTA